MKKPLLDGVIFDIDNVLIDTRHSYLDAIRWTVEIYLTHGKIPFFFKEPKDKKDLLLSHKDVDDFKLLGGFNDDWDCCYGILNYLLSLPVERKSISALRRVMDIKSLTQRLKDRPVGVNGITKAFGRSQHVMIEKISRIFQEIYLGPEIFKATENKNPYYWKKKGLIYKEKLIFKKKSLDKLKAEGLVLGIATGRPKFEAVFSLKHFGVLDYFDAMTTMDEVKKAEREEKRSLRKPNPFSLVATAKALGSTKKFCYVGDLPDDMLAAHGAAKEVNMKAVAFPAFTSDPKSTAQELIRVSPDFLAMKPSDVMRFVLATK